MSCTRLLLAILRHENTWTCCCTINSYHHLLYDDTPILPSPLIYALHYWNTMHLAQETQGSPSGCLIIKKKLFSLLLMDLNYSWDFMVSTGVPWKLISISDYRERTVTATIGTQLSNKFCKICIEIRGDQFLHQTGCSLVIW